VAIMVIKYDIGMYMSEQHNTPAVSEHERAQQFLNQLLTH